jgi:hypothetical protein
LVAPRSKFPRHSRLVASASSTTTHLPIPGDGRRSGGSVARTQACATKGCIVEQPHEDVQHLAMVPPFCPLRFKPAVRERELACDADVIQDHPNVRDRYASCLLRFARPGSSTQDSLDRCIGMTSGSGLLELRIRAILGEITSDEGGGGVATRTAVVGMMCAAYVVTAPILSVAFNSAEPFDLNRLTSITPISMRSRVGLTSRVNAQRRSRESVRSPASASQKL